MTLNPDAFILAGRSMDGQEDTATDDDNDDFVSGADSDPPAGYNTSPGKGLQLLSGALERMRQAAGAGGDEDSGSRPGKVR